MRKKHNYNIGFVIDKLTNSIENTVTGEAFDTEVIRITAEDIKQIKKAIGNLIGEKS